MDKKRSHKQRPVNPEVYPVGIPLRPPPGWQVAKPPPLPTVEPVGEEFDFRPRREAAPARRTRGTLGSALAPLLRWGVVVLLVAACVGGGWWMVQSSAPEKRQARKRPEPTARALPRVDDEAPSRTEAKEPPPVMKKELAPVKPEAPPEVKEVPPPVMATFDQAVKPVMERSCVHCHRPGKARAGLDLTSLAGIQRGGDGGPVVKPGDLEESALYTSVQKGQMPPSGKLPAADIEAIRAWIVAGAR